MKHGTQALRSIRAAYSACRPEPWQGRLPAWGDLTSAMREAFINVYRRGERDAFDEVEAARKRAKHREV